MNWGKLGSPAGATFKIPNSLCELEKTRKYSLTLKKVQSLNLWINWQKLCPNSGFTADNKIGNLLRKRLLTFQT